MAQLGETPDQELIFLKLHWGRQYEFVSPQKPGGGWTATAKFGQNDRLQAPTATELLGKVRRHYQSNRPDPRSGEHTT
jgi:hypothetical protein